MKPVKLTRNLPVVLTVLMNILLVFAVIFLMRHVQNLLNSDVKINLTEIVTQNKDVITSKLNLEVNNLDLVSDQLSERLKVEGNVDPETLKSVFLAYCDGRQSTSLAIAAPDGQAFFPDGTTCDISGRRYFRLAMDGVQNISDRVLSRVNGEEVFIISTPLYYGNDVVASIQRSYTPEQIYALCSLSLFSSQGTMCIINSDGYVLISSTNAAYSNESDNFYRQLYAAGNEVASATLEDDVRNNRAGLMEAVIDGQKSFSAYTPLEDIHDWYLITSIATSAVSPNAAIVIRLFYFILMVVIMISAVCVLFFFSYKNKQQAALRHIAFVDEVTGGNTYAKFQFDALEALSGSAEQQYHILSFDLDNFRYVNNYYGFDFGDKILRHIYCIADRALLPGETIARVSSDHFVLLLKDADRARLNALLDSMKELDGITLYLSAGLYTITDPAESISLMMDKATTAAHTVKGTFLKILEYYSDHFDLQMINNEQLKRSVEAALEHNEMLPYYQPKVDVNTGQLVGAEALARWRTADGRLIPPFDFIPMCEKTGLVLRLDMVIFEKVLQFLRRQLNDGITCTPISVNFSRLHLSNPDFVPTLMELVRQYDVPTSLVEIELTESAMFENYEVIAEFTSQLHANGLHISMDDFGSGYSSLNMLKDIPIDVLKIDRSFLLDTSSDMRRRVIISAVTKMAQDLSIDIVVEGVETMENVSLMKELGCTVAQGYYYAKPMDEAQFESQFREGNLCSKD